VRRGAGGARGGAALAAAVMRRYRAQVGLDAKAYVCVPSPGAGLEPV
jgi:galactokinase